jgi:hypothetical protein
MIGWFLLFLLLIVLISGGVATVLGYTPRPQLFGWATLIIGTIVAIITVDRWAAVLSGIFAVATVNALMMLITGHALNQSAVLVSRKLALLLTLLTAIASIVTATSGGRPLTNFDRVTCLGMLFWFVAMVVCSMAAATDWQVPLLSALALLLAISSVCRQYFFGRRRRNVNPRS